jgi:hypothetical protein
MHGTSDIFSIHFDIITLTALQPYITSSVLHCAGLFVMSTEQSGVAARVVFGTCSVRILTGTSDILAEALLKLPQSL